LTAEDGYQAQRSYSIASPGGQGTEIELTVERIDDGEVSPFLTEDLALGDVIELRGPIGGYFTWKPGDPSPLMLIAGGSGIVPLMSMLRTRSKSINRLPAKLLNSSRRYGDIIYRDELERLLGGNDAFSLVQTLTREAPDRWSGEMGRIDRGMLGRHVLPVADHPEVFVCGPTSFVEVVADTLVALGHAPNSVKTERFGPAGEKG
jgi:ferredoxin-NADP reductase